MTRPTRCRLSAALRIGTLLALLLPAAPLEGQLCPPDTPPTGNLWVSSSGTHEIFRFLSDGTPDGSFTLPGLSGPRSITELPSGELAVASQFSNQVLICDGTGDFIRSMGIGSVSGPTGAAMGPNGHYYLCSFNTSTILEIDLTTESVVTTHASPGLAGANCIIFRPDGGFLVTGQSSNDVHRFAPDGTPLGSFPTGQSSVMGGALDHSGRLLVAGGASNDVRRFTCDGAPIDIWTVPGGPQSIAVREDGTVFVTTFFTSQVRQYDESGAFLGSWSGGSQIRGIEFLLPPLPGGEFRRGDANLDGGTDLADAIATLAALFTGAPPLACPDAGDANDDGTLNIADPIHLLSYLFPGGPPPPPPFPGPGFDPTPDPLDC